MTELLNRYKNGKIYKIEPIVDHDEEDIYIGSTCKQYLCQRMNQHRSEYKKKTNKCKVILLFDKYGLENCNIILIESIEANNKMELHQREAHYIKTLNCVNKYIPLRIRKEYRNDNNDKLKEINKQNHNKNKLNLEFKNKKCKITKEYNELHKEEIKQYKKDYYQRQKELKKQQKIEKNISVSF
jgi:hypothetical protein